MVMPWVRGVIVTTIFWMFMMTISSLFVTSQLCHIHPYITKTKLKRSASITLLITLWGSTVAAASCCGPGLELHILYYWSIWLLLDSLDWLILQPKSSISCVLQWAPCPSTVFGFLSKPITVLPGTYCMSGHSWCPLNAVTSTCVIQTNCNLSLLVDLHIFSDHVTQALWCSSTWLFSVVFRGSLVVWWSGWSLYRGSGHLVIVASSLVMVGVFQRWMHGFEGESMSRRNQWEYVGQLFIALKLDHNCNKTWDWMCLWGSNNTTFVC